MELLCARCGACLQRKKGRGLAPKYCDLCRRVVLKENNKRARIKNADKIRERKRQDRINNSDKFKANDRAYYLANAERLRERSREWRRTNRIKKRAYQKAWMRRYRKTEDGRCRQAEINKRSRRSRRDAIREQRREYFKRLRSDPEKREHLARIGRASRERRRERISAQRKVRHKDRWQSDAVYRQRFVTGTRNRRAGLRNAQGRHTPADIDALYENQHGKCANCKIALNRRFEVDHIMPIALGGSNGPDNLQLLCAKCNRQKGKKHPDDWAKENGRLF